LKDGHFPELKRVVLLQQPDPNDWVVDDLKQCCRSLNVTVEVAKNAWEWRV
jgi:hypothetical protein